jgi:cytochrome c oxidase subunit II
MPMSSAPRRGPAPEALVAGGVVVLLVALVLAVVLSGAGRALYPPDPATDHAHEVRGLYDVVFALAVAIFLVVEGLIVWSIIRYRRKPTDVDLPPQTHGNNVVEIIWTVIPTAIVLFLFGISYNTLVSVDTVSADPGIRVHAVAGQFQWKFEYLDATNKVVATQDVPLYGKAPGCDQPALTNPACGGMALPVGKTIQVSLDSPDVIHAWYVPRFLFKRDVVPGQTNRFEFTIDQTEVGHSFRGQCAELCGTGHRTMLFTVNGLAPGDYDAWLAALVQKANATPPPAPSGVTTLQLAAQNIQFQVNSLDVAANQAFAIDFKNMDPAGVAHDVDIRQQDGTTVVKDQPTTDGGKETTYVYDPLPAGTYTFLCSIHPGIMHGTLTVH